MHDDLKALKTQRDVLRRKLADLEDMRPGSLVERYRKCGKPTCRCANKDSGAHGPSWSLTPCIPALLQLFLDLEGSLNFILAKHYIVG